MVRLTELENNIRSKTYDSETYIDRLKYIQEKNLENKNKRKYSIEEYQRRKKAIDAAQQIVCILMKRYKNNRS